VRARAKGLANLQAHALGVGIPAEGAVGALGHPGVDEGRAQVRTTGSSAAAGTRAGRQGRNEVVQQRLEGRLDETDLGAGDAGGAHGQYVRDLARPVAADAAAGGGGGGYRGRTSCAGAALLGALPLAAAAAGDGAGQGGPIGHPLVAAAQLVLGTGGGGPTIALGTGRCAVGRTIMAPHRIIIIWRCPHFVGGRGAQRPASGEVGAGDVEAGGHAGT